MTTRYALPGPVAAPHRPLAERVRDWLLHRWAGQVLVAALALLVLQAVIPLPCGLGALAKVVVWGYVGWGLWRGGGAIASLFLWRIRTKLIFSHLFIAVVPLALIALLVFITGLLYSGLVAGHTVSTEVAHTGDRLRDLAQSALLGLDADGAVTPAEMEERLAPARLLHPDVAWALVRDGKVLARKGDAPVALPGWWKGPGFAGLVQEGSREVVRGVWSTPRAFLVVDAPLDRRLLASLESSLSIRLLTSGGRVIVDEHQVNLDIEDGDVHVHDDASVPGMKFAAPVECTEWESGHATLDPLTFTFDPREMVRRLSPGTVRLADILVRVLAVLAVIFLGVYVVALLIGWLLVRSVTRSVHHLTLGTERLRRGEFGQPIPIGSRDQLGDLSESFNMMARGIENLLQERAEKERLEEELRIARQIQMSLLPQGSVTLPGLRIAALCLPAAEVGGDYYDLLPLSPSRLGVLVADVSGKGTSAALYMAELKGLVLSLSRIHESPARLLSEANRILAGAMDSRSFVTMTYAVVDTARRTLRFARAGHNPLLHLEAATGVTRVLTPPGLGLGLDPGDTFDRVMEEVEIPLAPGDVFLFFTDGLSEAMNAGAELFGETRLRDLLTRSEALGSEEIKEAILAEVRAFVGEAAPHDDMTLVILKVASP